MPAYQSRSLSLISQQTRRLGDRVSRTLRQLKTAAIWGAQILLYPVYLGFQATRLAGRQLQQEMRQIQLELEAARNRSTSPAVTSVPLLPESVLPESVLPESVLPEPVLADLGLQQMLQTPTDLWPQSSNEGALAIQGVACRLEDRQLVLIASQNEILDILTPEQTHQLQQRVVWEIANYHYRTRTRRLQERPFSTRLPLPSDRPQTFLPIRLFRRVMGWMQQGPVAKTVNLFQEASPNTVPGLVFWIPPAPGNRGLTYPEAPSVRPSQEVRVLQSQTPPPVLLPPEPEPWLNLSDLFDSPVPDLDPQVVAALLKEQAGSASLPSHFLRDRWGRIQRVKPTSTDLGVSKEREPGTLAADAAVGSVVLLSPPPDLSAAAIPNDGDLTPTWIEADVQVVGYVKHPLEQIVEWLDRMIEWFENRVIGLTQRLGDWLRSDRSEH